MISVPVRCVVDASVGIKLIVAETDSSQAHQLFAHSALDPAASFHVPDLFFIECANILWKLIRRGIVALADAQAGLTALTQLSLVQHRLADLSVDALNIGAAQDITAYDAAYVAIAARENIPLITADDRLIRKLTGTSYRVVLLSTLTIPLQQSPPGANP
jgi:predicted nucleic acid-binding protein